MKRSTIELELPADIVEKAQGIAQRRNCSLESVMQDGLQMIFGAWDDSESSLESLQNFSDEQLWKIINHPLTWAQDSRLRELTARGKRDQLTPGELEEQEDLLDALDRRILLRSRALVIMKRRGLDVDGYLGL